MQNQPPQLPPGQPEPPPPLPADIVDPGAIPDYIMLWITLAIAVFLLLLLVAGGIGFFVWWSRRKTPAERVDPFTEAWNRIEELRHNLSDLEPAELGLELTKTAKRFIYRRFGADLQCQTTQEFWATQEDWETLIPQGLIDPIVTFLSHCDALKFGAPPNYDPEKTRLLDEAGEIIETATPEPSLKTEKEAQVAA